MSEVIDLSGKRDQAATERDAYYRKMRLTGNMHQLLAPAIIGMRESGATWKQIASLLRFVAGELDGEDGPLGGAA